jgi:uncharacterized membrane protein YedE/YeeE
MGATVKALLSALAAGLIFGAGLCLSGMTDPHNVLAFLDFTGHWSPNLAGVMVGAIAVHASWLRWGAPRRAAAASNALPPRGARVDAALVAGAALFGVGWGLAGYCPGPALVALSTGALGPIVFVGAMVVGMRLVDALRKPTKAAAGPTTPFDDHDQQPVELSG